MIGLKSVGASRFGGAPNYAPTSSLTTPTYDASGETTEPTWIRKPSWVTAAGTDLLAHNPLTGGSSDVENPSLLISNDNGSTWTTPPGLTNPIAPKPTDVGQPGANADCHLVADPNVNRLVMCWMSTSRTDNSNLNGVWYSVCTDPTLVTWGAPVQLIISQVGTREGEPKIVWDAVRGCFLLFTVDISGNNPFQFKVRIGGTSPVGTYGTATVCSLPMPKPEVLWHMDIIQEASGRFVMAFCDSHLTETARQGWLASSWDGIRWTVAPRPFMGVNAWAVSGVYRPAIQPARTGSGYDLIVSRHQTPTARLGLVRNVPKTEVP